MMVPNGDGWKGACAVVVGAIFAGGFLAAAAVFALYFYCFRH